MTDTASTIPDAAATAPGLNVGPSVSQPAQPKMSKFVRNSFFGTIAGFAITLGNFFAGLIVARVLGVEGSGVVAFVMWVVTMAVAVGGFGLPASLQRYVPELTAQGDDKTASRLSNLLFWPSLLASVIAGGAFVTYGLTLDVSGADVANASADRRVWLVIGLWASCQLLAEFGIAYLQGLQRFDQVAKITSISFVLQIVLVLAGSFLAGSVGAVLGYVSASLIPAICAFQAGAARGPVDKSLRKRVLRYSAFRWAAAITAAFVWARMEVFFLEISHGTHAVGLFTAGLMLASIAVQGPQLLTRGLMAYFSEQYGLGAFDKLRAGYATSIRIMALMVLPCCFGLAALAPEVVPMLYGEAFRDAIPASIILVCASAVGACATIGAIVTWVMERSDFEFYTGIAGAILASLAGLIIIPEYGIIGAALSRAATQIALVATGLWFLDRVLKCPTPYADLFRLFVSAVFCAVAARLVMNINASLLMLPVAILAGAITYVLALRFTRAVPPQDLSQIEMITSHAPKALRPVIQSTIRFLKR